MSVVVTPRYPAEQDRNERGLSMLRAQYVKAGNPRLAWSETPKGAVIIGSNASVVLMGEGCRNLATLICRAVSLGWLMLNELEPSGTAQNGDASGGIGESDDTRNFPYHCPCCRQIRGNA